MRIIILPTPKPLETQAEKDRCAYITTFYNNPFWIVMGWIFDHTPDSGFWLAVGNAIAAPFDYADGVWRRYYARRPDKEPNNRWFLRGPERKPK